MQYYSVVNTLTGALQTVNGEVARYPSFYAARVERITLNDLSGGYDHFTKENTRTKHWQVIVAPTKVKSIESNVDREVHPGFWERRKVTQYYVTSADAIKPISRAPGKRKATREMQAYERALFSLSVKKTKCRIRKKK